MKKVKELLKRVWQRWYVKYVIVGVVGVAVVVFIDDNSLLAHWRNTQRIDDLQQEIDHYKAIFDRDGAAIRQLDRDPQAVERIARERYFMKADDEDIFVLRDDTDESENQTHETIE